jgi:hypothetical protein
VLVIRCHHLDSAHHVHSSHNLHSARRDPPQLGALDLNGFLPQSMHPEYAPRVCTKSIPATICKMGGPGGAALTHTDWI